MFGLSVFRSWKLLGESECRFLSLCSTVLHIRLRYPYPPETYENVFAQLSAIVDGEAPGLPDDADTPDEVVDGLLTADVSENSDGRPLGRKWSPEARDWIRRCLIKNADERATYPELLASIFSMFCMVRILIRCRRHTHG